MWALILMSVAPTCLYAIIYLGWVKSWYILVPMPGRLGRGLVYAFLPLGLAFTMELFSAAFPGPDPTEWRIWETLFLVLGGIGVLFMTWPPSWIKPRWVRWLEREYGYGLHILLEEARAMGRWRWEARVRTREGLESWVQEVLEKREKDMSWAWKDWVDYHVILNTSWMKRRHPEKLGTIEQFTLSSRVYVPRHREKDYQRYLKAKRREIAKSTRIPKHEREKKQEDAIRLIVKGFQPGERFTVAAIDCVRRDVSWEIIYRVLNQLRVEGQVECTGRGRSARWRKV